jgi:hypothetical protein
VLVASVVAALALHDDEISLAEGADENGEPAPAEADNPEEWDERVVDLVKFVEEARGLQFDHPVQIDFLSEDAFLEEMRQDEDMDEEDRQELEELQTALPMMRALGLMEGDVDLFDTMQDLQAEAVAAFYEQEEKRIVVPATELTTYDEMIVVHELTHALQDQHFDLDSLWPDPDPDPDEEDDDGRRPSSLAIQGLVEGDANRIDAEYVESLPPEEQAEIFEAQGGDSPRTTLDEFPSFLVATMGVPYTLGETMTKMIVADGDNEAVDAAFTDPPSTGSHLLDPRTFLEEREFDQLDVPDLASDVGETTDDGEFDALDVYLTLGQRVDLEEALEAADGWGGGSYAVYAAQPDDDLVCVRIDLIGAEDADGERLSEAFDEWAAAAPEAADVTVDHDGELVQVDACDPGSEAELADDRADEALTVAFLRSSTAQEFVQYMGLAEGEAWDAAECLVADLVADDSFDLTATWTDEDYATINDAVLACVAT